MFLDIVQHKQNELLTAVDSQESEKRKRRQLIFQLGIQQGWKVLVVWPEDGDELSWLTRLVGSRGELVAITSEGYLLEEIEAEKQRGAYQAMASVVQPIHPAFMSPKEVNVPVHTLVFNSRSLDFPDDTFDAVWCGEMKGVETAVAPEALTQEFYRVVRPGGLIAIYQPGQPYQY